MNRSSQVHFLRHLILQSTVDHAHVHWIPRREGDVPEPKRGIRWIIPEKAVYSKK